MKKIHFKIAFLLAILTVCVKLQAQEAALKTVKMDTIMQKLSSMTVEDYANLELPSLSQLYENARKSNSYRYYSYNVEIDEYDVKAARMKPLDWIKLVGTYNYGNTDIAAVTLMQTTYQVWSQNASSQQNSFYNVGVTLSVPLKDIFNTRNEVRQSKARMLQSELRLESELDLIKEEIVKLYCTILEKIASLEETSQLMVVAQAQYNFAESNFINNRADAEELYRSRSFATSARVDYEVNKRELNDALLRLEIISCTPIVSGMSLSADKEYKTNK